MDAEVAQMKLDIIRWTLEDAETIAEEEYKELCREKPKEYGDRPFCIKENTYKLNFYREISNSILFIMSESDSSVRRDWERMKGEKGSENKYFDWGA